MGNVGKGHWVFGPFQFDPQSRELTKLGARLRLEDKPALVLARLLEHAGDVLSREELRNLLWPTGVHVDFEHGLNKTINKLRCVLSDNPATPKYVETLPRIGYRFVAPAVFVPRLVTSLAVKPLANDDAEPGSGSHAAGDLVTEPTMTEVGSSGVGATAGRFKHIARNGRPAVPLLEQSRKLISAGLILTVVMLVAVKLVHSAYSTPSQATTVRSIITPATGTRLVASGDHAGLALSPDGTRVVFSAIGRNGRTMLWLRHTDALNPEPLAGTEGGSFPFWSPDSSSLGFFTDMKLERLNLSTGKVTDICEAHSGRGGSWSAEGTIVFALDTRSPIYKVPAMGGTPIPVTRLEDTGSTTHRWPEFLADGKRFVFFAGNHDVVSAPGTIYLGSVNGTAPTKLMKADSNARPAAGSILFVAGGTLFAQPFNMEGGALEAAATVVAEDIDYDRGLWYANFAVSTDGLVYRSRPAADRGQVIALFDAQGNRVHDISNPGAFFSVSLAPDGHAIAGTCGDPDRNICLVHMDGTVTHITASPISSTVIWSPNSQALAYDTHRGRSSFGISVKPIATDAAEHEIISGKDFLPESWHPDGEHMLVSRDVTGNCCELLVLDLQSQSLASYLPLTPGLSQARYSPNGRWVAYQSDQTGTAEIYVASYPAPSTQYQVTKSGGSSPRWSRNGRQLYFLGPGQTIAAIDLSSRGNTLAFSEPRRLFSPPILMPPFDREAFDVDWTGKNFVVNTVGVGDTSPLVLVSKWK